MSQKTSALLLLCLVSLCCLSGFAQRINGALIAGGNIAQVDGDEVFGYKKAGWNTGAAAMIPVGPNSHIQIETLFSQKGAYQKYSPQAGDTTPYYNLRLNYLEVPVLFTYNDRDIVTAGAGFSWARLSNMTEIEHGKKIQWVDKRGAYNRDDFQFVADLRFRLVHNLHFNGRYAYSLKPVRIRTYTNIAGSSWNRRQFNNLLTFRLVWIFNEKVPEARSDRK